MGFFSRKSKLVRKEASAPVAAPVTDKKKHVETRPQSSHGLGQAHAQAHAKQHSLPTQSRSVPTSRRTSFSTNPGLTAHPAYAQNNIFNIQSSAEQSYLPVPVPMISSKMPKDKKSASKAAKVLGVQPTSIPSAPNNPRPSPHSVVASDSGKLAGSRHDSVNSNVDAPRIGKLNAEQAQMSFSDELAMDPAFPDEVEGNPNRRSMSSIDYGHSRNLSHDSFRPTNARRHTLHQAPQGFQLSQTESSEVPPRGRSHQSIPSYSMPTNASRAYVQAEYERHASKRSEATTMAAFAGAYQPRASSVSREQLAASSPILRPQRHTMYAEDAASIRSYAQPTPMSRQLSYRQSIMNGPPPLSILDGFKVNRRGKILDEEGEMIGELIEGDIIDCVRQKANAYGEVLDECGRVVGRVQTLLASMAVSSPSIPMASPAVMAERNLDYFDLQQSSPSLDPVMNAQAIQRKMQEDGQQKYRMLMDIPPVPSMPAHFQDTAQSPALNAKRHTLATFDQFDGSNYVELPAEDQGSPTDRDVPIFDLSEPFIPKAMCAKTPELIEAPSKTSPTLPRMRRASNSEQEARTSPSPPPTSLENVSSASSRAPSSNSSSISALSSHTSNASIASTQGDDDDEQFQDAASQSSPVATKIEPISMGRAVEEPASAARPRSIEQKLMRPLRQAATQPRIIVPVSQLTQQTIKEDVAESPVARPITAVHAQPEILRPAPLSRARTAPSPASASMTAVPPMPRADAMPEPATSATTSGYTSAEESLSEAESVETPAPRKEVRISNLPPTTIPSRGLIRSMSDGSGLSRITAMPSVPESAPLPDTPHRGSLLSPSDAAVPRPFAARGIGARSSAPLPAFPRGFGNSLPSNPFAVANAANNNGAGLQKRNSMPNRPGMPALGARSALARNSRLSPNAPLVSSPLSDHRKTMSSMTISTISSESSESTPPGSDNGNFKKSADAMSIISTMSTGKKQTFFTHNGRVTVEDGDLPPSALAKKDEVVVAVIERPDTAGSKTDSIKKRRFSLKFGSKKTKAPAVAAH